MKMLSFDIQAEIMKRLPVKSLIQFRSVCKAWKSFIDGSHFIAGYNVPPDQPQHLMITYRSGLEKHVCFIDDDDSFPEQKSFQTIPHLARSNNNSNRQLSWLVVHQGLSSRPRRLENPLLSLCLMMRKQVCNVWMMEHGYQQVFTRLYTILSPGPDASFFWTISFRNNGEAIIVVNDDEEDEHMFSQSALVYDPCLEHIKDLGIRGNRGSLNVNSYTESLLLLNHDAGHIVNYCTWSCEELTLLEHANKG